MIAAVCAWHERHADAADEITRRLRSAELMLIAAPTLIESYAVLTRLPPPHRMAPEVVLQIIEESFVGHGRVVALDGRSYRTLVHRLAETQITGGRAYDAVIAECACASEMSLCSPSTKGTSPRSPRAGWRSSCLGVEYPPAFGPSTSAIETSGSSRGGLLNHGTTGDADTEASDWW